MNNCLPDLQYDLFVPWQRNNLEELRLNMLPNTVVQAFLSRQPAALVTCAIRLMIVTALPSHHFGFTSKQNGETSSKAMKILGVV